MNDDYCQYSFRQKESGENCGPSTTRLYVIEGSRQYDFFLQKQLQHFVFVAEYDAWAILYSQVFKLLVGSFFAAKADCVFSIFFLFLLNIYDDEEKR